MPSTSFSLSRRDIESREEDVPKHIELGTIGKSAVESQPSGASARLENFEGLRDFYRTRLLRNRHDV